VPVACASYFEDMFVDFDLAQAGRGIGFRVQGLVLGFRV
jgi:hypothetical protein